MTPAYPDMLPLSVEFLDKSQTFLGVIIALLVLMLYKHDGNLFYKILENIKNEGLAEISGLEQDVNVVPLSDNENFKKIYKASKGKESKVKGKCLAKIVYLNLKFNKNIVSFQSKPFTEHINRIFEWREVNMAPFYTFMTCLGLFVVDELMRYDFFSKNFILQLVFWFFLFSLFHWTFIWTRYVHDARVVKPLESKRKIDHKLILELLAWIMLVVVLLVGLSWIGLAHAISRPEFALLVVLSLICFFKGFLYWHYLLDADVIKYQFVLKHIGAIALASMFVALITYIMGNQPFSYQSILFSQADNGWDIQWLRLAIFGLIILNGIILPFIMPYRILNQIRKRAEKESADIQLQNSNAMQEINADMQRFIKDNNL